MKEYDKGENNLSHTLQTISDEEVVSLVQENNEDAERILYKRYDAIISKYIKYSNRDMRSYSELYSNAQLVLMEAVQKYDTTYKVPFERYFKFCLKRRFIDYWRSQHYKNHFVHSVIYASEDFDYLVNTESISYEDRLILNEDITNFYNALPEFETEVAKRYYDNMKAAEIAKELNVSEKKIYNTVYAIKKKVEKI